MAKNKISEFSSTPANNTDIGGINISEGCAPSGINNALRELMAQLKDQQAGTDSDNFTVGGGFTCTGAAVFSSTVAVAGVATFTSAPVFPASVALVPSGVIVMWSGSIASIPSGWLICDGSNSTPDLRNRFVIGANADDAGVAKTNVTGSATQTGGSADAIVVSHTHTITDPGHNHTYNRDTLDVLDGGPFTRRSGTNADANNTSTATTGITIDSTGSSGTNANLPPYYALAYIMKS
jgi:microcystin-dependent protein